jgi:hypothetical protein
VQRQRKPGDPAGVFGCVWSCTSVLWSSSSSKDCMLC